MNILARDENYVLICVNGLGGQKSPESGIKLNDLSDFWDLGEKIMCEKEIAGGGGKILYFRKIKWKNVGFWLKITGSLKKKVCDNHKKVPVNIWLFENCL